MVIQLIGPGGAGKSTTGVLLAERLNLRFLDLDRCFSERMEDISEFLQRYGYPTYARENINVYLAVVGADAVVALSSGFMTYAEEVHPCYPNIRMSIAGSPTTFVLLPRWMSRHARPKSSVVR